MHPKITKLNILKVKQIFPKHKQKNASNLHTNRFIMIIDIQTVKQPLKTKLVAPHSIHKCF